MRYKLLGNSGLRVSEICLGTMTFGEEWGNGTNAEGARQMFDLFIEKGGNFLDTANYYTNGTSERILGSFIQNERERYVIATKFSLNMRKGDPNGGGNHRKNIRESLEASLKRLNTDYIDLYWLHAWDFTTSIYEVMRTLDDLVASGKVMYIGISDTPAWIVSQANTLAELKGWTPFVALQIEYSLIQRTPERDLLPMAKALGLTVTPWSPLGAGLLTGKYTNVSPQDIGRLKEGSKKLTLKNLQTASVLRDVAGKLGNTATQIALNWLRNKGNNLIPIVGARNVAQLNDSLSCLEHTLPAEFQEELDRLTAIELGFPHDFLNDENVIGHLYGGTYHQIDRN